MTQHKHADVLVAMGIGSVQGSVLVSNRESEVLRGYTTILKLTYSADSYTANHVEIVK
jgi:hypothetical protein